MDVFNIINAVSSKMANYFTNKEKSISISQKNFLEINNKIILWIKDSDIPISECINYISKTYNQKYLIYNISHSKLDTDLSQDKIIDFNLPKNPSFTLEFILSFCISAENWINAGNSNILIIYDDIDINEGKIFFILSALISFYHTKKTDSIFEPISIYADLTSKFGYIFKNINSNIDIFSNRRNNIRYLNYFSEIEKSPLISLKKIFLVNIMISGAPAIDNDENEENGHFITINKNSYYIPIIRIKSNNKYIYSSYNTKSSENNLTKMKFSEDNVIKFSINKYIFNDIEIEVLHKGTKCFKLLFTIQFNTFFMTNNYSIKFSRDQIDSINNDIRYPIDFFVDLHFDNEKEEKLSSYDEYTIYWKSLLSKFIIKSLKENKTINNNKINLKEENKNLNNEDDIDINININDEKKEKKENINNKDEEIIDIDLGNTNNTLYKVNNLLKQLGDKNYNNKLEDNDDNDDEDIEKYLESLENK
jgi:hypothetical protein